MKQTFLVNSKMAPKTNNRLGCQPKIDLVNQSVISRSDIVVRCRNPYKSKFKILACQDPLHFRDIARQRYYLQRKSAEVAIYQSLPYHTRLEWFHKTWNKSTSKEVIAIDDIKILKSEHKVHNNNYKLFLSKFLHSTPPTTKLPLTKNWL